MRWEKDSSLAKIQILSTTTNPQIWIHHLAIFVIFPKKKVAKDNEDGFIISNLETTSKDFWKSIRNKLPGTHRYRKSKKRDAKSSFIECTQKVRAGGIEIMDPTSISCDHCSVWHNLNYPPLSHPTPMPGTQQTKVTTPYRVVFHVNLFLANDLFPLSN